MSGLKGCLVINMKKVCKVCGMEKDINEFRKNGKYYRTECRKCENEYNKKYYEENKENINKKRKEYHKQYYKNNKEEKLKYAKNYRLNNKDKIKESRHNYYEKNKNKVLASNKAYQEKNIDHLKEYRKKYGKTNRERINNYQRNKMRTDSIYKLKHQVRNLLYDSFRRKGKIKSDKTENILGCNLDYFISYLLNSFEQRYGYKYNYDETVHIDHIIPLSKAESENEIIKLCNYKNLQLLKANDNLCKSDKNNDDFFERNFGGVD